MITGREHSVEFPRDAQRILIPFESKWGPISIEVGLVDILVTAETS